jgi:hypothetical protein
VCVCSLRYPAYNAHAPYCHLCPAPLYSIFPHYLTNGTIFEKKLLNTKCVFWFSLQLLSETFLILRRIQGDIIVNVYRSARKVPAILVWNFNFSAHFRKKNPQIPNFVKNRPAGAELLHADRGAGGQADTTKLKSRLSKFCERAYKFTASSQPAPSCCSISFCSTSACACVACHSSDCVQLNRHQ